MSSDALCDRLVERNERWWATHITVFAVVHILRAWEGAASPHSRARIIGFDQSSQHDAGKVTTWYAAAGATNIVVETHRLMVVSIQPTTCREADRTKAIAVQAPICLRPRIRSFDTRREDAFKRKLSQCLTCATMKCGERSRHTADT